MKNYTGQFDKYENTNIGQRIWLKNVIPNSLGYCSRYIDLSPSINNKLMNQLLPDIWLEFNGVDISGLESDKWEEDNDPEIRCNTYVQILK